MRFVNPFATHLELKLISIPGLHMLLFQLIEFGMGCDCHISESRKHLDELRVPARGTSQNTDRLLHSHFSWPQVASVADSIESSASCPVAKKANSALGSWMTTWENRLYREYSYERTRVTTDSLPFFWLAKLYIVLHCCEVTNCDNPVARVRYFYDERKSRLQSNIIRWLSQLHGRKSRLEVSCSCAQIKERVAYRVMLDAFLGSEGPVRRQSGPNAGLISLRLGKAIKFFNVCTRCTPFCIVVELRSRP
jgi:hypothetical protein